MKRRWQNRLLPSCCCKHLLHERTPHAGLFPLGFGRFGLNTSIAILWLGWLPPISIRRHCSTCDAGYLADGAWPASAAAYPRAVDLLGVVAGALMVDEVGRVDRVVIALYLLVVALLRSGLGK